MIQKETFDLNLITREVEEEVIGQEYALTLIHNTLATNFIKRMQTKSVRGPLASFLLVGHTGVGKTETAKQYARQFFEFGWQFYRVDMSEYSDYHTVSSLVGAPKGYVGSDTPGRLTGHFNNHPVSVLLIDELEKGHPKVYDILLQILDEARLTDMSFGFTVHFPWSIIFITSNLASEEISRVASEIVDPTEKEIAMKRILQQNGIRPEILGRVDRIVPFVNLSEEHYKKITEKILKNCRITYDRNLIEETYQRFKVALNYGVREYVRQVENYFLLKTHNDTKTQNKSRTSFI